MPSNISVGVNGVAKCNSSNALNRVVAESIAGGTNAAFNTLAHGKPSSLTGENTIYYASAEINKPNTSAGLGPADTIEMGGSELAKGNGVAGVGGNNIKTSEDQLVDSTFPNKFDIYGQRIGTPVATATLYDIARVSNGGDTGAKYGRTAGYRYVYRVGIVNTTRVGATQTQ